MEILFRNFKNIVLTLFFWTGDNTDLSLSSNISKAVTVNLAFIVPFLKKKKSFLMISRLIDFALVVL